MAAERTPCMFFQAEDGIRDIPVTGVQSCALPILARVFQQDALPASTIAPVHLAAGSGGSIYYFISPCPAARSSGWLEFFSKISYNILSLSRRSPTIFSAFLEDLLQYSQPFYNISYNILSLSRRSPTIFSALSRRSPTIFSALSRRSPTIFSALLEDLLQYSQ